MIDVGRLLATVAEQGASDLHMSVGRPPVLRIHGKLRNLDLAPLTPEQTEGFVKSITPERNMLELEEKGSSDFAIFMDQVGRFRANVFRQKNNYQVCMRLLPLEVYSFDQIGLPKTIKDLLLKTRGLILVTGPTGSGKSTSLASMIDYINVELESHIITIEDPIEFYHDHKQSVVTQREIGVDTPDFTEALRRALRQDPDVILVGEMRDLETISAAITAAETGHLVMGTLHTTGAARTVDRIIDAFPADHQDQIRMQLSVSLVAVISQVLLPRADGQGRVAGLEIMIMTPAIENHIRKGETFKIPSVIQTSKKQGMVLLDDYLLDLCKSGMITPESALRYSQSPKDMTNRLSAGM